MDKQKYYLIMATTTNQMLNGEKWLTENQIETDLVPAPVEYGSVCAIAIKIKEQDLDTAKQILEANHVAVHGYYEDKPKKLQGLLNKLTNASISREFLEVLRKVEEGETLQHSDIVTLLSTENEVEMNALFAAADRMRKEIVGDVVDIRGAIEFSNYCIKNCNYCGVRRELKDLYRYRMTEEEIMEIVHELHELGIKTVILQSGEDPWWTVEKLIGLIKRIKDETKMRITLSIGERPRQEYAVLKEAGANNFLLKIETTNPVLFSYIHPDDDFEYRKKCSMWLKELGYINGSGCMIGLPTQTVADIANDILYFKEMGINMIGIGPFLPAKGTPYENQPAGDVNMTLKAVAVTRLVCKNVFLPATTALATRHKDGQTLALKAGANTIMLINTPRRYRENYQIYSGKNMVDLQEAIRAVKESGRKLPKYLKLEKWGLEDAEHTNS